MNRLKSIRASTLLLLFLFTFAVLFVACKPDTTNANAYSTPIEQAYFEDYDSPENKWGYIDVKGRTVLEAKWDDLKEMQDPLTAANYQGKWGYIDLSGEVQIPYQYKQVTLFENERAFVQDFQNKWLLINPSGQVLDTTDYTQVTAFQKGYSVVARVGLKGVIDVNNGIILSLKYNSISILGEGKFIVKMDNQYGLVENTKSLSPLKYDKIYDPSEGLLRFKKDGAYGYMDLSGQEIKPLQYDKASNFEGQVAMVSFDGNYHLINRQFSTIKSFSVDNLRYAGEGLWKYKQKGKWGLVDSDGQIIMTPRYELINKFRNNRVAVSNSDIWGYCDNNGKEVIPLKYPLVWDFYDGRARFIDDRGVGFIDKDGKIVIRDKFLEVRDFSNGKARFQTF